MSQLAIYSLIFISGVFISSVSQVLLKKAAMKEYPTLVAQYMNPLVISAYAIFFGATLIAIFCYKVVPLSMGPILESVSYIFVAIFGFVFFKEKFNRRKILALALIIAGIGIYSLGV